MNLFALGSENKSSDWEIGAADNNPLRTLPEG